MTFWKQWQIKIEQNLNGFIFFCFVVDAKYGGGKQTLVCASEPPLYLLGA